MPKYIRKRKSKTKSRVAIAKEVETEVENGNKGGLSQNVCDVCTLSHATEDCPLINTGVRVEDALLPKKAFLTLPNSLETKDLDGKLDVISKYALTKGTQFGPFDAPKTNNFDIRCPYVLKIFKGDQVLHFLDTTDQNKCNWMSLVRFTNDSKTHNCICYQLKQEIYFTLIYDVPPGQPLVVAYSPGYSVQLEKSRHLKASVSDSIARAKSLTSSKISTIQLKNLANPRGRISVPVHSSLVKIEGQDGIFTKTESVSNVKFDGKDHYDHDYVAPSTDDLKKNSGNECFSSVRRSNRKRRFPVTSDFKFGKIITTNDGDYFTDSSSSSSHENNVSEFGPASDELALSKGKFSRKGQRLNAVRAVDKWTCKFCHEDLSSLASFALHLIEHYKKVGVAKTEKDRIQKLKIDEHEKVSDELNPKVVLIRLKEHLPSNEHKENTIIKDPNQAEVEKTMLNEKADELDQDQKIATEPVFPYECDICIKSKIFNRAEYIIRHLRNHSGEMFCYECNVKFSTKDEQWLHECSVREREAGRKPCTLCDKSYSSFANLRQHLRIRHDKSFKCNCCHRLFNTDDSLKNHICKPKKSKFDSEITIMHKCNVCDETFQKLSVFEKHLKTHDLSLFTCTFCSKVISNDNLKIHIAICEVLQKFLECKTQDLTCPCHNCQKNFPNLQDFKDHVASHTHPFMCPSCNIRLKTTDEIRSHLCTKLYCDDEACDNTFVSLTGLKGHISKIHGEAKSYCFECAFPFVTAEGYIKHGNCDIRRSRDLTDKLSGKHSKSTAQKEDGMFICEVCGAFYTKWSSMKTHRYTHGPKKFVCDQCGKGFHRKELLSEHVFVHEEPQFVCSICEKKFKSKKSLEVHLRIHNNIKPYGCPICHRRFTQKVNLRSHEITHVPEDQKGFVCPVDGCDKTFFSKEYMKFHIEAHEKGKKYSCDVCDKQFVRSHMLNQHKRTSHGDHKYRCEFCSGLVYFRQKHSLYRHFKKQHPTFQEVWSQDGYGDKMYIPGDGMYNHQSIKTRPTTAKSFLKIHQNSSSDEEGERDIQEHADMTVMISGSMEDGTEEIEIEAQEVELGQLGDVQVGKSQVSQSHQSTSMVLLHLDSSGRYILAFPNPLQKLDRCDEEEYVMEEIQEIGTFE